MKKFELGQTVMTAGVQILAKANPIMHDIIISKLESHQSGDWGDMAESDKTLNEKALIDNTGEQGRLMSSYKITPDVKIWIITEWDRSVTTILLPSEG